MEFQQDFTSAQETLSQALISTTRSASCLAAEDLSFHQSLDADIGRSLDRQCARLLALAQKLLERCLPTQETVAGNLMDVDSIDTNWGNLVDATDGLLERADTCLDEYNGLVRQATPRDTGSPTPIQYSSTRIALSAHISNIPKPQLLFETKPQDAQQRPFRPLLSLKPHASVPLEESLTVSFNNSGDQQYSHPYAAEISTYEYPPFVYSRSEPLRYPPFETTTATWVDNLDAVFLMLEELKGSEILAIDLEHHDKHSYIGIVSLMQISTRDRDWIIDTLKPWRRQLEVLNDVFADPSILKVLHGAHMDIMWLQRDLGLYVVGLFDTHHASRVLGYPGGSLAYLLKRFVDFDAQKQYQTADWRVRPLPQGMFDYARSDTHFLIFIFECIRNDLVDKSNFDNYDQDKVQAVLERSKMTALQRYEHTTYDEQCGLGLHGWFGQLQRSPTLMSKEQFAVYRKVHQWRDMVARQEDESPHQIMTRHVLTSIYQALPKDVPNLLSICHPISQPVRLRANELLKVIQDAQIGAAEGPEMRDVLSQISTSTSSQVLPQTAPVEVLELSTDAELNEHKIVIGATDCRLQTSHFWGATLMLRIRVSKPMPKCSATTSLPLPAQRAFLPATSDGTLHPAPKPLQYAETSSAPTRLGKRKNFERDFSVISDVPDEAPPISNILEPPRGKSHQMHRKGEKKIARQASTRTVAASTSRRPNYALFDYTSAPSVLNNASALPNASSIKSREGGFDLYGKAADARTGIRQMSSSTLGKSQTFTT